MRFPILIEPTEGGRYRAHAGSPFTLIVEGATETEAAQRLSDLIAERMKRGIRVTTISLPNAAETVSQAPLAIETLPEDDWFFRTLREAIVENRLREDEAGR